MIRQSTLPKALEARLIKDVAVGVKAYTAPWAMRADSARRLWLNGGNEVRGSPNGMPYMLIRRTEDGFVVEVSTIHDYRYTPTDMHIVAGDESATTMSEWVPAILSSDL